MAKKYPSENKYSAPRDQQMEGLKLPPHSIEAEQSVLGGLMLDNDRWDTVSERVTHADFTVIRIVPFLLKCKLCSSRVNPSI